MTRPILLPIDRLLVACALLAAIAGCTGNPTEPSPKEPAVSETRNDQPTSAAQSGNQPQQAGDRPQQEGIAPGSLLPQVDSRRPTPEDDSLETATLGAGCFWCVEAIFKQLEGVESVKSGYSGGTVENPTYEQVCQKTTGHAEVCQIRFDPTVISFDELLEVFWKTHDPTTLDRQGPDEGPQYRSAVFYHGEEQKTLAEQYKKKLAGAGAFSGPIVTEITPFTNFYPAENYHDNYFRNNPAQPYCQTFVAPKVEKFKQVFGDKLKK